MKIICIGRNYPAHNKEMGSEKPAEPVFFMKPDTALLRNHRPFYLPQFSDEIHYECELVIRICKLGKCISPRFAHLYFKEIGLGIDFTARDIQKKHIESGLPWEKAKSFDFSALVGDFLPITELPYKTGIPFSLKINGLTRQEGISSDLIFGFENLISYVSQYITLRTGDFIFTGTPSGVGKLEQGDFLEGFIQDKKVFSTTIR